MSEKQKQYVSRKWYHLSQAIAITSVWVGSSIATILTGEIQIMTTATVATFIIVFFF